MWEPQKFLSNMQLMAAQGPHDSPIQSCVRNFSVVGEGALTFKIWYVLLSCRFCCNNLTLVNVGYDFYFHISSASL